MRPLLSDNRPHQWSDVPNRNFLYLFQTGTYRLEQCSKQELPVQCSNHWQSMLVNKFSDCNDKRLTNIWLNQAGISCDTLTVDDVSSSEWLGHTLTATGSVCCSHSAETRRHSIYVWYAFVWLAETIGRTPRNLFDNHSVCYYGSCIRNKFTSSKILCLAFQERSYVEEPIRGLFVITSFLNHFRFLTPSHWSMKWWCMGQKF